MTTTTTTTIISSNGQTLAARAAGLLTKTTAYAVVEKGLNQALAAKRVFPPLAEDFGAQLGLELPLKTKDFVRVVANLLASSEKPVKGVISKRKNQILTILSDLVAALTDTPAISLPAWAIPKERTKKEEAPSTEGTLERANAEALANESAEAMAEAAMVEAKADTALAKAVALVVANAAMLSEEQKQALFLALESVEA